MKCIHNILNKNYKNLFVLFKKINFNLLKIIELLMLT